MGHDVELFTSTLNEAIFPESSEIDITCIRKNTNGPSRIFNRYSDVLRLARKIGNDFDVLNPHNFPMEITSYFAKNRTKTPVVWMCNEPPFYYLYPESRLHGSLVWPVLQFFDKRAVKNIDRIAVLDDLNKARVKRVYGRSSDIVRTGVDLFEHDSFDLAGFRSSYSLGTGKVILQVGTAERKRPEDTIGALSIVKDKFNCVLVLVGLDRRSQLNTLARDLAVSDRVRFLDAVTEDELWKLYEVADIISFPAVQTWGLVAIEAMAKGKPVIVSRQSGVSEIIQEGVTGLLMNPGDPFELARKMIRLLDDPSLALSLGRNARDFVRENISWEKYAKSMSDIFERVIRF